ncbi:bifunctional 2-C-methyl-D-erythritol 4-phosphate cytidylyltransferase/2-C-methyl-D-erythritol 2,4-cyclodiphosphate synthase [Tsuneonella flava]|uniref:Bifunctional enzyme IspD/IspF n=1 Tax=Tsuneonella flava TaxID=2055955 RepID=A0ABX7K6F3_9SPHN|nr:bifunctional 2-C-methyl-D-erythritol 4-phosphate cytidylyltransferase/2-C-methyl-D-erythritol 2,4-cyclodiphosphate synthase [Tsuneonella flava]QSB43820.1 bifunctional 2-C-methyl-D-erythritol 4-phosphate cytidylyltransferase/2-C-methyl-D-erythritol 2,4-cyclodiphosphate synthase [Tsuneonella flava]
MAEAAPLPSYAAIVVAAGKGQRAGQPIPKQFVLWRGKPVVRHSVEAFLANGAVPVIVVIPPDCEALAEDALRGLDGYRLVPGGATRQESVAAGLQALRPDNPERVLIHDAARPDLQRPVIEWLLQEITDHPGAIPVLPVVDSLVIDEGRTMAGTADRDVLRRVQTPQAFRYLDILDAHASWQKEPTAGDDAQVLRASGGVVRLVKGDERLAKLTFAEDFLSAPPPVRTGTGFDVHRLVGGEDLWLCGIQIPHSRGLSGHSDADVALHAVVDALLGAVGAGDIGSHFPPSDPQWQGAPSSRFVEHAVEQVAAAGYRIGNIDLTLICEEPKIGPHRLAMRDKLAEIAGVEASLISVKATTTERLGFAGRSEGIAAQAVATVLAF